jgi:LacI family transcriptional regulator
VLIDNAAGAYAATHELVAAGHRVIAMIGGPAGLGSADERRTGFLDAMADAGLGVRREHLSAGALTPEIGREAARAFVRTATPPTAIFAADGHLAAGARRALRAAGLSVPGDISVAGFGDLPLADLLEPPLTTIREPLEAMGRAAVQALFELLNGRRPPSETRLPVTLIERHSVAPPPGAD